MLFTFLYELTAETPDMRATLYRTELIKVFFTVLHFYILSMIFSNWLQTLRKFIIGIFKLQERLRNKTTINTALIKQPVISESSGKATLSLDKKKQLKRFTLSKFTLSDTYDLFLNQFDQYVLEECQHFLRDPQFMQVMREI